MQHLTYVFAFFPAWTALPFMSVLDGMRYNYIQENVYFSVLCCWLLVAGCYICLHLFAIVSFVCVRAGEESVHIATYPAHP